MDAANPEGPAPFTIAVGDTLISVDPELSGG